MLLQFFETVIISLVPNFKVFSEKNKPKNKMIDCSFVCTYPYYDPTLRPFVNEPFDLNDVLEFECFAEDIYRCELLHCLGLEKFHSETVIDKVNEIFLNYPRLHELVQEFDQDILFSYHNFFKTLECIKNNCTQDALAKLAEYLEQK
jgi:hypothetical protein